MRADGPGTVVCVAGSPTSEPGVYRVGVDGTVETLRAPRDLGLDPATISVPEPMTFTSTDAAGAPRDAHALFYPPATAHAGPDGELPPLLVVLHGGPTGAAAPVLNLGVQYWTSRGFGVVDVDYGGSSGYGRAYREQLRGAWGVVDVADCLAAASALADAGRVDPKRLAIRGGSAGGFTTLAALARDDTPFAAGADHFGVADLEALALETHKFESRYLDGLIGPYPEARDLYVERSPITHVERFTTPLIVLQGDEDAIVPPNQSEMIVEALRRSGVPVAYLLFAGEQHGFRQAEQHPPRPRRRARLLRAAVRLHAAGRGAHRPGADREPRLSPVRPADACGVHFRRGARRVHSDDVTPGEEGAPWRPHDCVGSSAAITTSGRPTPRRPPTPAWGRPAPTTRPRAPRVLRRPSPSRPGRCRRRRYPGPRRRRTAR